MSKLRKDDPVYYKVEINKLMQQARDNGLKISYKIKHKSNKVNIDVIFMNDIGEVAIGTVYDGEVDAWEDI